MTGIKREDTISDGERLIIDTQTIDLEEKTKGLPIRTIRATLACLGLSLAAGDAVAALPGGRNEAPSAAETIAKARAALERGDAAAALRLLEGVDPRQVRDRRRFDFMRGLALLGLDRPEEAIGVFKALLNREPGLLRVRLELARAFFETGDDDNAKRQFERVLAAGVPTAVRVNVGRFLRRIRERRRWWFDFSLGIAQDSNINQTTSGRTVVLGGLPFRLSEDTVKTSGYGLNAYLGGTWLPRLADKHTLHLAGRAWIVDYAERRFDEQAVELFGGYRWPLRQRGEVVAGPVLSQRWLSGERYASDRGGRVRVSLLPSPRYRLQARMEGLSHRFPDVPAQDGHSWRLDLNWVRRIGTRTSMRLFGAAVVRRAERASLSYNEATLGIGGYRELPFGFTAGLRTEMSWRDYRGKDRLFGVVRRDRTPRFSLTLGNRLVTLRGFYPRVTVTYTRRNSTLGLREFDGTRFNFDVTRRF